MSTPTWLPNPHHAKYDDDLLMTSDGQCIARVEYFGGAHYPSALNAATGNWERGGPHEDGVAARMWAERVSGLHPVKPSDARPEFYYDPGDGTA